MASGAPTRRRLSKPDRRAQLLDAAATLLLEQGAAAMTMERLAEYAQVSKALPYSHFDNADEVLVAVYERVVTLLGTRVLEAVRATRDDALEDRITAVVDAYFAVVAEQGPILDVVTAPGARAAQLADTDGRVGRDFVADLLATHFGVEDRRARAAAPVLIGALTGAARSWGGGHTDRATARQLSVDVVTTIVG